jgi:HEAT repeat protein
MKPWGIALLLSALLGCTVEGESNTDATKISEPLGSTGKLKAKNAGNDRAISSTKRELPPQFANVTEAISSLASAVDQGDANQVRNATKWLSEQGEVAVAPLSNEINRAENDVKFRVACLNVLTFLGPVATPQIVATTQCDTRALQLKAIEMLGGVRPVTNDAIDRLIAMVEHDDDLLRRAAIQSLGRIGQPAHRAVPKLQAVLNSAANDSLRGAAQEALKSIDPRKGFHKN